MPIPTWNLLSAAFLFRIALLALLSLGLFVQAEAQTPGSPADMRPVKPKPSEQIGDEVTAFDIVVRTPPGFDTLRDLIDRHVGLQRYRALTDLDESELARLIVLAERDVRNLVGTLGYFSPDIAITREIAPGQRPVVVIAIKPNDLTRITDVNISFEGDIEQTADADGLSQRNAIVRDWRLPSGRDDASRNRLQSVATTRVDSRGLDGATDSAENSPPAGRR